MASKRDHEFSDTIDNDDIAVIYGLLSLVPETQTNAADIAVRIWSVSREKGAKYALKLLEKYAQYILRGIGQETLNALAGYGADAKDSALALIKAYKEQYPAFAEDWKRALMGLSPKYRKATQLDELLDGSEENIKNGLSFDLEMEDPENDDAVSVPLDNRDNDNPVEGDLKQYAPVKYENEEYIPYAGTFGNLSEDEAETDFSRRMPPVEVSENWWEEYFSDNAGQSAKEQTPIQPADAEAAVEEDKQEITPVNTPAFGVTDAASAGVFGNLSEYTEGETKPGKYGKLIFTDRRRYKAGGENDADTGALRDKGYKQQDEFAKEYYTAIRNRKSKSDVAAIAKHTSFSEEQVSAIRNHIFEAEHDLGEGKIGRFEENWIMAQAWQRLERGEGIDLDILLLNHELEELTLMKEKGYNYPEAHTEYQKKYP